MISMESLQYLRNRAYEYENSVIKEYVALCKAAQACMDTAGGDTLSTKYASEMQKQLDAFNKNVFPAIHKLQEDLTNEIKRLSKILTVDVGSKTR